MTTNHLILDFSHVYCDENIPKNTGIHWLDSTEAERRQYIKNAFPCIADCEMCGLCTVFRGKRPGTCLYRLYQWKVKLFRGIPVVI